MKKLAIRFVTILLCLCTCGVTAWGAESLIPVGQVIGLELQESTVTIAAFDDVLGVPARKAGLQVGDRILEIDGKTVSCAEDVHKALQSSQGSIRLRLGRKGKDYEIRLQPQITGEGPKIGVFLKQGVTGIGTVTWYDPDSGQFGTLGHGVNGSDGALLKMAGGKAYAANVVAVQPGKCGQPGQLRGSVAANQALGQLVGNTDRGVFGVTEKGWQGKLLPVAAAEQIRTGAATILSTVSGEGVREYSVEILKIYPKTKSGDKNMVIRVTDPALLETTGGIVQGMGVSYNKDNQWNP